MPFMVGRNPIRRTLKYLEAGKLYLKSNIQVFSINYNTAGDHHRGAKEFVHWYIPQIQYKNPTVQILPLKNLTPSPFIRCYYENGKEMLIDIDSMSKEEILEHLLNVIGKSRKLLEEEKITAVKLQNPANVGTYCSKQCLCEIPGHVPCPAIVPLPYHMRGKTYLK